MDTSVFVVGTVTENRELVDGLYKVTIKLDDCKFTRPGQYAVVSIPGTDYERAYTVCEYDGKRFSTVFLANSDAAKALVALELGAEVDVETGLGNGFDVDAIPDGAILAADTDGIPQMLCLLRELIMQGKRCSLVLGYSSKDRIFMVDSFSNLCNNIEILTQDGSNGRQGNAYDAIRNAEYVCAAGSVSMLDNLSTRAKAGQFNLDGMNVTTW